MEKQQALDLAKKFIVGSWNQLTQDDIKLEPFG